MHKYGRQQKRSYLKRLRQRSLIATAASASPAAQYSPYGVYIPVGAAPNQQQNPYYQYQNPVQYYPQHRQYSQRPSAADAAAYAQWAEQRRRAVPAVGVPIVSNDPTNNFGVNPAWASLQSPGWYKGPLPYISKDQEGDLYTGTSLYKDPDA